MRRGGVMLRPVGDTAEVPFMLRLLGKLVLEVLPAAAASVIGAFLFAYSQFGQPAVSRPAELPLAAAPAPADMGQLVRDEHSMVSDFLLAQQDAANGRAGAADAADIRVAADAKPAADRRRAVTLAAAKPAAPRSQPLVIASAAPLENSIAAAQLPPVVIAGVQPETIAGPVAPPAPETPPAQASLVSRTLAVPGDVVHATLRAVMVIGGIPSWIGHRVSDEQLDGGAPSGNAAS